ncbi:unnamed protein product [Cladocopium goreaui]|uniref:Cold shock-like protein n=1 Tax=Cladocopium goreaui TaxID=2562237 RepID=A0A9P1CRC8_9DINO|nr:unnamed protein product [Cladocopium goreaui]
MALTGVVKSFNPHKGWGFIESNGQDVFLYKGDLKGICVDKGTNVQFTMKSTEKGTQAENVVVIISPDEASYFGEIKSFNSMKGYGFITSEAFPNQDIFLLKTDIQDGYAPGGCPCRFKVTMEEKGPRAQEVQLLGQAAQDMSMWGGWGMKGMKGMGKGMGKMGKGLNIWQPMFMKDW